MKDQEPRRIEIEAVSPSIQVASAIEDIAQFSERLAATPQMLQRIYTATEITYCGNRMSSLAGRFAAKTAMRSLLETDIPWQTIEIASSPSKQPVLVLYESAQQYADTKGFQHIAVSLTHDEGLAAALVAISTNPTNRLHLGIDIGSTSRIAGVIERKDNFLDHVYSPEEQNQADGDPKAFTILWAGKEAVSKAVGTGMWRQGVNWKDVEILKENNLYVVRLSHGAKDKAEELGIHTWHVAVQEDDQNPIAYVIGVAA